jgi:hypothetical protein
MAFVPKSFYSGSSARRGKFRAVSRRRSRPE